ncbi:DUF1190 domain-containing protein [Pseudomonas sp. Marseille-QA0892]
MRTRNSATLVLAGALPLALAGCNQQDSVEVTATKNFKTVQECVDTKFPVDICSDAYMNALADHRRIAPVYDTQAACDADFVPDYCQATSDGNFMPRLGGFELTATGQVNRADYDHAQQQGAQSGGYGVTNGLLTGLLIGNLLSNRGGQYYSQPIYQTRDGRGNYGTSTLSRQMESGKTFSNSHQARNSSTSAYTRQTLGRSLRSNGSDRSAVGSTISRGGFGSQASARSGWGGRSSGGFSFGG